jgi:hypothetical protein
MANMEIEINAFIASHELDESAKDELVKLVNKCFSIYVSHMSSEWLSAAAPTSAPAKKAAATKKTAAKAEKIENAADAESLDQLISTACTSTVLNDYCRENGLRIGGVKKDIASRVWRHLQGESEDDDISPRSKPKKAPAKKQTHPCFACNAKGQPCGLAADNEFEGNWFCFRHIDSAEEIIEKKNAPPPAPKPKASPKSAVSKKPAASLKKKAEPEPELEEEEDDE